MLYGVGVILALGGLLGYRNDAVLAGLLGFVHGAVGSLDHAVLVVRGQHLRDACAEGDQHFFIGVQEELLGEFALQAGEGDDRIVQ